jgi:hypothetical protein
MVGTSVALIIFNRPSTTARVFAEIAKAKPRRLFVIADGPRADRDGEAELCVAAREVTERVDWDCEVKRNYSDTNMGNYRRVPSGITWAFEHVEELIVLEDDCVPDQTFFRYCEQLLDRYRADERIMHIAGNHLQPQTRRPVPFSYTFARWNIVWGWATWKRAWRHFDITLRRWPELRETSFLADFLHDRRAIDFYRKIFDELRHSPGEVDAWDHAWSFACWSQNGLTVMPSTTLVGNVGFGADSTHFPCAPDDPRGRLSPEPMAFELSHPTCVVPDGEADDFIIRNYVIGPQPSPLGRLYMSLRSVLNKTYPAGARVMDRAARTILSRANIVFGISCLAFA